MEKKANTHYLESSHLWAPFTQHLHAKSIPIVKAKGAYLYDSNGNSYLDGISSWWVTLHGHAEPYIAEKIAEQARHLEHVMLAGFVHPPACLLAKRLCEILPRSLTRVFYSDNGSTAVETALKIAMQFWYNQARPRSKILAFKGGYHGDTIGAGSLSSRTLFCRPFDPLLFDVEFIDPPSEGFEEQSIQQLQSFLSKHQAACFIFEPLLQAVGGMKRYSLEGLDRLIEICRSNQVITIADEVAVGFGRTGSLFVSNRLSNAPDIVCLAKGLTGGFIPMGATVCAEYLFEEFLSEDLSKALLHGHSYTGNPLGCAAALASLELLLKPDCEKKRKTIESHHSLFKERVKNRTRISRCEVIGTILVIDYCEKNPSYYSTLRDRLLRFFFKHQISLRPFGNTLHLLPPYCIEKEELYYIYETIEKSFEEII